jgi:hypothetical protein
MNDDDYIPFEGRSPKPSRKVTPEELERLRALMEKVKQHKIERDSLKS